jgi:hypothetical protein
MKMVQKNNKVNGRNSWHKKKMNYKPGLEIYARNWLLNLIPCMQDLKLKQSIATLL